jgi:hypothetical protein
MNDPDGMVQTIREQEKHIADLELRLKLREKRAEFWRVMSMDLYDHLIDHYDSRDPELADSSLSIVINKYEEATRYGLE